MTRERIRELLLQVWGEQACRNPAHWPETLAALMAPGTNKRGSAKPWVDHAVIVIGEKLDAGEPLTSDDVWRAFSKLDEGHCHKLALLLNEA